MKGSETVKCSISAELEATALVQASSYTCFSGNQKALRLIVINITSKKRALAGSTSLLTSLGCGVSGYLTYLSFMSGTLLGKTAAVKAIYYLILGI